MSAGTGTRKCRPVVELGATKGFNTVAGPVRNGVLQEVYGVGLSHICAYGAPRMKPTEVVSNDGRIRGLCLKCLGNHEHIALVGKSPHG